MKARFVVRLLLVLMLSLAGSSSLFAHAFAPALLEIRQLDEELFEVRFKQPALRPVGAVVRPSLPPACQPSSEPTVAEEGTGIVTSWQVRCLGGLRGQTVGVDGIASLQADVLLRLELMPGGTIRHVLTADRPSFTVPAEESRFDVALSYGRLGVEHILGGYDHLLFVLGLILLVGGGRRLLLTITAFTGGHSITLALAVLGVVNVPQAPVEVLIAGSIYWLAVELADRERQRRAGMEVRQSWLERRPGWMAGGFGLLHGLGFAGALSEVGLPAGEVPAALFAFNVGIELGQLAFVGAVLALWVLGRRWLRVTSMPVWSRRLAFAPAYGIGTLAAFWVLERIVGIAVW